MMPCLCWVLKAPGLLEVGGLGQEGAEFPPALVLCRLWTWTPKEIRTGRAYGPCRRISASLVSHGFVTTALEVCCFQGFQLVPNRDQKPHICDTACGDEEENVAGLTLVCLLFLRPQANYWSLLFLFPLPSPLFPQLSARFMPRFHQSLPKCHIISEAILLTLLYFSPEYLALSGSHKLYLCLFIPSPPLYHKPDKGRNFVLFCCVLSI